MASGSSTGAARPFAFAGFRGEIAPRFAALDDEELQALVRRVADPAAAEETVHWGRNYLYRATLEIAGERVETVVKQFRNNTWRTRLDRRLRGSKAERSWARAWAFWIAGVATAEPLLLIESQRPGGPSFFITRHLGDVLEARYLLRARNTGREREEYPAVDYEAFLERLGQSLRQMHEAGLFHRDVSIGNVLLSLEDPRRVYLIDLNRARQFARLGLWRRNRDLCRLAIFRPEDQARYLAAYWGEEPGFWRRFVYQLCHRGFLFKIESKKRWRGFWSGLRLNLLPRGTHPHIPDAPKEASRRDKIVWDALSDQPHQHAGRFEKTLVRLADLPSHVKQGALFLGAAPRILGRYRALSRRLYEEPVPWDGTGIAIRPDPEAPEELLQALDDLGVRRVLLRLHPWAADDRDELELVRELAAREYEIAFALPQNRELARDPERWRSRIAELAEKFTPYGRHFQVGQAVNRSKWGFWTLGEYVDHLALAAEVLRRYEGVEILGPAVIDFEIYATVAALHLAAGRGVEGGLDALASLLYVDRRGAPENTQLGFDTVGKVVLLRAVAETCPGVAPRSWITEVNWPLWEGPHSPAGKSVSVSEDVQADYLARFYLLALTTGMVERVYWWQLVARGYGLIAPRDSQAPRRRPGFAALATLEQTLRGAICRGRLEGPPGAFLFRFSRGGEELVAGWWAASVGGGGDGPIRVELPRAAVEVVEQDGMRRRVHQIGVEISSSVRYFLLE